MNNELICTPVMLPTTDISAPIHMEKYESWLFPNKGNLSGTHHLYLVSNEEIKEGDWMMMKDDHPKGRLRKCWEIYPAFAEYGDNREQLMIDDPKDPKRGFGFLRRSETYKVIAPTDKSLSLPLIPNSFIEEWVAKQGKIDKVKIKIHTVYSLDGLEPGIIILPIEEKTYSREELKEGMLEAAGWGMLLPSAMRGQNADKGHAAFEEWFDKKYPI